MQDKRKGSAQRGYGTQWQKARAGYLRSHPLCVMCQSQGIQKQGDVVDHIVPHRGDKELFWDSSNWQTLCFNHHNSDKQRQEKTGVLIGGDISGMPVDPNHHWNR